jgi:L-fuculose-phosphate aldolase
MNDATTTSQHTPCLSREVVRKIFAKAVAECANEARLCTQPGLSAWELYHAPATEAIKQEILRAGRKLWERQYVDGNGGNISCRIAPGYVLSTPTLCSKGDLRAGDISLVDMENNQIFGDRPHTSEIKLHLEIYKAEPRAKAVLHCHPPYATAYAVAGVAPRGDLIPEQEVFVGPVAYAPYETPGSDAVARSVLPLVHDHNTILLGNHGIVCWADTVTHVEWYAEVVDTYCKTLQIAEGIGKPLKEIPPEKIQELLAIKQKLGLPDPRLPRPAAQPVETPVPMNSLPEEPELAALVENFAAQAIELFGKHR